eukprot:12430150-Karenia_brevis.AAC.1
MVMMMMMMMMMLEILLIMMVEAFRVFFRVPAGFFPGSFRVPSRFSNGPHDLYENRPRPACDATSS